MQPHELRHTAASLAIASGANVKVVQQMLGHKSATVALDVHCIRCPIRLEAQQRQASKESDDPALLANYAANTATLTPRQGRNGVSQITRSNSR